LNEEAGKLLLEDVCAYESRARMFTQIHAKAYKEVFPTSSLVALSDSTSESVNVQKGTGSASPTKSKSAATATKKTGDAAKKNSLKRL
jgi:hypothetical protein